MSLARGNEFQLELVNDRAVGVSLTAAQNTFPAPAAVFDSSMTDWWPVGSGDAYSLEVSASEIGASANAKDALLRLYYEKEASSVDAGADTITFADPHGLETADGPSQWVTSGSLPGGIALATDYWIIRVSDLIIKLATNEANARSGTNIDITSAGTGTQTMTCLKIADIAVGAALQGNAANGRPYQFPIWIPRLTKIMGSLSVNNAAPGTGQVKLHLACKPTKPWALFACTFVRTFGATPASSSGTAVTPGNAVKGSYVALGVAAEDLRAFAVGVNINNAVLQNHVQCVDLTVGPGSPTKQIVFDCMHRTSSTEGMEHSLMTRWGLCLNTETIYARVQNSAAPVTGFSAIGYGMGGRRIEPTVATATGTVTISGSPAANGKTVEVYARDTDGITELVGTTTTGGGTGAFSLGCPDTTRAYFAKYEDGADFGVSQEGTPGSDALDITIGGGGGPAVPPTLTNLSPANGTPITPDTALQFEVDHVTGWAIIIPMIILDTNRVPEPTARGIIDADFAFEPLYEQGGSVRTLVSGNKYRYTLRRKGGWTATPRLMLWAVGSDGGVWVGP